MAYPGVHVARNVTFEEIWTLFQESGFLYPEKIARLEPVLAEIQETNRRLIAANGESFATVVLKPPEGAATAHMSILRSHRQTWMVQHLAAMPLSARRSYTSARLTLGFTFYGQMRPDIVWVKMFFRPNNPWPNRVFGGFAKQLGQTATADLRTFHYLTGPTTGPAAAPATSVDVAPALPGELPAIAAWFHDRGRDAEVQANELTTEGVTLGSVSSMYASYGLERHRECLVARAGGLWKGFALLDISSHGLNLSELTNAFTVHLEDDRDQDTRLALILAARQRYKELGRPQCIALDDGDDLDAYYGAGFRSSKDYCCFTFHREHLAEMEAYFQDLFLARFPSKP